MYIPRTFCNWIILCSYLSSGIRTVWYCKCAIVVVHWLVYNMYKLSPHSSFLLTIVACFWRIFQLPFSPIAAMFLEKFLASLLICCCMFLENFLASLLTIAATFSEKIPASHLTHFCMFLENFLASIAAMVLEKFSTSLVNHCCNSDPLKPFLAADFCQLIS